jgi:SAM-dependent methyltransferase
MSTPSFGTLLFRCNVCGDDCQEQIACLDREVQSCRGCGSTVRDRSIVHMLSMELFGRSLALPDFPVAKDVSGLGLSDSHVYAVRLADKLCYTNTFLDREPCLDITETDATLVGKADFVIASDVFEHVPPPVSRAFRNARRLLKPGGLLLFTTPYTCAPGAVTQEHFPDLHDFTIALDERGKPQLRNVTASGRVQVFDDLTFHSGSGLTLEFRVFSEASLIQEFLAAGFGQPRIYREPEFRYGIYWQCAWSLPMAVRARIEQSR